MDRALKIGIFGGTFNPPHEGHRRLAAAAAEKLGLDKVLVMPACIPPHKQPKQLAGAKDRAEMCRFALLCDERFEVSTLEIERGEKSYTIDTLKTLEKQYPSAELYLIIGSDMLDGFRKWYCWEEILERAFVCAASREKGYVPCLDGFTEAQKKRIIFIDAEPFEISSGELRLRLARGEAVGGYIAEPVMAYIDKKGLYADRFPQYRALIEEKLDPNRLYHSFCVARAARELAAIYSAPADKAELAGLLHDVMKNAPAEEQKRLIEANGCELNACELANRKVWHAMAGEAYLRLEAGITDEEILSAVRWHTTGKAGMSLLDKIVYIADFISEDRTYPDVEVVRGLAAVSLDRAVLYTGAYTIKALAGANRALHVSTVECYNDTLIKLTGNPFFEKDVI